MIDYTKAIESTAEAIAKGSKPLTKDQKMVLAGAMAMWLDKAREDGKHEAYKAVEWRRG